MKDAPLFVHAYDLHGWLLDRLDGGGETHRVVRDTVLDHSRGLLAAVTLAVSRFDPGERLIDADEQATHGLIDRHRAQDRVAARGAARRRSRAGGPHPGAAPPSARPCV